MIVPTAQAVLDKISIDRDAIVSLLLLQLRDRTVDVSALCIVLGLSINQVEELRKGIDLDLFTATMLANRISLAGAGSVTGEQLLHAIRGSDYRYFIPSPFRGVAHKENQ